MAYIDPGRYSYVSLRLGNPLKVTENPLDGDKKQINLMGKKNNSHVAFLIVAISARYRNDNATRSWPDIAPTLSRRYWPDIVFTSWQYCPHIVVHVNVIVHRHISTTATLEAVTPLLRSIPWYLKTPHYSVISPMLIHRSYHPR